MDRLEADVTGSKVKGKKRPTKTVSGLFGGYEANEIQSGAIKGVEFKQGEIFADGKLVAKYRWHKDKMQTVVTFLDLAWCNVTGKQEAESFVRGRLRVLGK